MQLGLYEQLINKIISIKINQLDINKFNIQKTEIDKAEASKVLSQYLFNIIQIALNQNQWAQISGVRVADFY
jgi:hypothetical protein